MVVQFMGKEKFLEYLQYQCLLYQENLQLFPIFQGDNPLQFRENLLQYQLCQGSQLDLLSQMEVQEMLNMKSNSINFRHYKSRIHFLFLQLSFIEYVSKFLKSYHLISIYVSLYDHLLKIIITEIYAKSC